METDYSWIQVFMWGVENILKLIMVTIAKLCEYAKTATTMNSTLPTSDLSVSGFFFFIFKLYISVLVLPNIKMNPPQVYMCSPS